MTYKLTYTKDRWIVAIKHGGYFSTPSLALALEFIQLHANARPVAA